MACEPAGGDTDTDTDTDTDEEFWDPDNMGIQFGAEGIPFCGVDCEGNPGIRHGARQAP